MANLNGEVRKREGLLNMFSLGCFPVGYSLLQRNTGFQFLRKNITVPLGRQAAGTYGQRTKDYAVLANQWTHLKIVTHIVLFFFKNNSSSTHTHTHTHNYISPLILIKESI